MTDNNVELNLESMSNSINSLTNTIKSLQYSLVLPSDFLDGIRETLKNSMPDLYKIRKAIAPIETIQIAGIVLPIDQLVSQLSENQFKSILDVLNRNEFIFQELQSSLAFLDTTNILTNPSFIGFNPTFDNILIQKRNETETSNYNGENFNSNEFKHDDVEQKPNEIVSEITDDLNSKIEKFDKGFFHGFITPFSTKDEFGRYVSQEIINILLSIIMTYAVTVGAFEANKILKIIILSIVSRFNH